MMFPSVDITILQAVAVALTGYAFGSVPFGIVMARLFGLGDLRKIGSGNIGATNVLRTGHKLAAFLTLVLDAGKGAIAVALAWVFLGPFAAQIAGFFAFVGHCFPFLLGFRGGKGVATFLGTLLALSFPVGLAACLTWLVVAGVMRISSAAALAASVLAPLWAWFLEAPTLIFVSFSLAILICVRHHENIGRLWKGEEPRIGKKGK